MAFISFFSLIALAGTSSAMLRGSVPTPLSYSRSYRKSFPAFTTECEVSLKVLIDVFVIVLGVCCGLGFSLVAESWG